MFLQYVYHEKRAVPYLYGMAFYTFRYIRAGEKRDKQTAGTKAVWLSCGAVVWYLLLLQRKKGIQCAELPYLKFYHTEPGKEEEVSNIREFRLKPTNLKIKIDMRKLNRLFPAEVSGGYCCAVFF
mgnify:CR=1 FL=1